MYALYVFVIFFFLFPSYNPTPCVPAIDLSHSHRPRWQPFAPPPPDTQHDQWTKKTKEEAGGVGLCACELRAKAMLDVKRHFFFSSKNIFGLGWQIQSDIAATLRPTPNAVAHRKCSTFAECCQQLVDFNSNFLLIWLIFFSLSISVSFKAIIPLDITLLPCIPLHQK